MTIDITNPEHREALAWACEALRDPNKTTQGNGLNAEALFSLSDPAKAAELIRALVERAGLRVIGFAETSSFPFASVEARGGGAIAIEVIHVPMAMAQWATTVAAPQIPPIITRLLALAPGAGPDAGLAALRGEP